MFWWLYRSQQRVDNGPTPWPTVLWLQGGPVSIQILILKMNPGNVFRFLLIVSVGKKQGASGVGLGNFLEIGPLDIDLKPRNSTWLQNADLLFVVNIEYFSLFLISSVS